MKSIFVSRKQYEEAVVRANKAELALFSAFGISTQDVLDRDVKQLTVWVGDAVLERFAGDPEQLLRNELHRMLDKIIDHKPGVISGQPD